MNLREQLAKAHANMRSVCVTGTNGKTTTTSMLEAIVRASGEPCARITTLGAWVNDEQITDEQTSDAFAVAVERAQGAGVRTIAIETTSKALAGGFAHMWPAHVAVFTNLSRDHLDYHATPEHYLAAKAQLFMTLPAEGVAVLNASDPASALIEEVCPPSVRRAGFAVARADPACSRIPVELAAAEVVSTIQGTTVRFERRGAAQELGEGLSLRPVGEVHAGNALAAALAARTLGYGRAAIVGGLEAFVGVPGRFEVVGLGPFVVVDYAHTPDALAHSLQLARRFAEHGWSSEGGRGKGQGRVICVFGCGGERDRGKRPEMGGVAARGCDVTILTTDNPRSEDPERIANEVEQGARAGGATWIRVPDRAEAIQRAVGMADPDRDVVLIAGKGHERFQIVGDRSVPFSDVDVARAACALRGLEKG